MILDIEYAKEWDSGVCFCCDSNITEETRRPFLRVFTTKKGDVHTYCYPSCVLCNMQECAILEADDEKRRYTTVGVFGQEQYIYGYQARCLCGRASYGTRYGECLMCKRERNMLSKAEFRIRQLRKFQTQINKLIKEEKNGTK